jgi:hypothetical protein
MTPQPRSGGRAGRGSGYAEAANVLLRKWLGKVKPLGAGSIRDVRVVGLRPWKHSDPTWRHGRRCRSPQALVSDSYPGDLPMAAPDYLEPILAAGGPIASAAIMLRFGSVAALQLLAGAVAILTKDAGRAQRCLEVLRILRNKDSRSGRSARTGGGDQEQCLGRMNPRAITLGGPVVRSRALTVLRQSRLPPG